MEGKWIMGHADEMAQLSQCDANAKKYKKKKTTSAIFCGHANEMPVVCKCPANCYCKENACAYAYSQLPPLDSLPIPTKAVLKRNEKLRQQYLNRNKTQAELLVEELERSGYPVTKNYFSEEDLKYFKKLDKQVMKFLKAKDKAQQEAKKCTMIFKERHV